MTIRNHIHSARTCLTAAGISPDEAARDASLLARHQLGWGAATLLSHERDTAPPDFAVAFDRLIERRVRREPIAYIRGVQEFWGRDFFVSPAVLIPRPETELVVEIALAHLGTPGTLRTPGPPSLAQRPLASFGEVSPKRPAAAEADTLVCDVGTGSGCLAITLAAERPNTRVVGTDTSGAALGVARTNAERHQVADRITFLEGAYFASTETAFDLIVSNPPYVTVGEYPTLAPEVRDFEPGAALVAGVDGLRNIREIVDRAPHHLTPGGVLLMEIGHNHADAIGSLVHGASGLTLRDIREDLQGIPRVAVIERS